MRIVLVLLSLTSLARAAGFDDLQRLAGRWMATQFGGTSQASFELISRGTAVLQKSGFTAAYYRDGGTIGLMLFPDEGNAQRFRCDPGPAAIECKLIEVANPQPGLGAFKSVTLTFPRKDDMVQRWVWQAPDGKTRTLDIDFHRAAAAHRPTARHHRR